MIKNFKLTIQVANLVCSTLCALHSFVYLFCSYLAIHRTESQSNLNLDSNLSLSTDS